MRHNHPFLAAGANSSPDGRARRDAPFPATPGTSRSGHGTVPGHHRPTPSTHWNFGRLSAPRRRHHGLTVTHATRREANVPDNDKSPEHWAPGSIRPSVLVGDTGIEPVTSSVSGKRAPAAPIARADDGTRTRDPHLGKVMLYQLSHIRVTPLWGAGRKLAEVSVGGKTQSSPCPHEVSHAPPTRLDHRAAPGDLPGDAPT